MKQSGFHSKDPTQRFSDRVDNYVRYRPGYPGEIVPLLRDKCGLTADTIIADIGSGPGKLTELFLTNGNRVFGVEPNREMREAGERLLKEHLRFTSMAGTAEATTLPEQSVDLIVAGQAFHWFIIPETRKEFQRILKPGGWVVLLWNDRQLDSTPFLVGYEKLLQTLGTDYAEVNHRNIDAVKLREFYGTDPKLASFPYSQLFDYSGLEGRLLSSSYVPAPGQPKYEAMLTELRRLFDMYEVEGQVSFDYDTRVYFGRVA